MESIEYAQFVALKNLDKKNLCYFNNLYGPNPYIQQNILRIPFEMLKDVLSINIQKKQPKSQYKEEKKTQILFKKSQQD